MVTVVNVSDGCGLAKPGELARAVDDLRRSGLTGGELDVATSRLIDLAEEHRLRCGMELDMEQEGDQTRAERLGAFVGLPLNLTPRSLDFRGVLIALAAIGGVFYLSRRAK